MDALQYKESQRLAAGETAKAFIEGRIGLIEGCRKLNGLAFDLVPHWAEDQDFVVFGAVASQTDELPVGSARQYWDALALKREDARIADAESQCREQGLTACRRLLERLRDASL
jgi:hypothetical protein